MLSRDAVARIVTAEVAQTSGFVLVVVLMGGVGLRWCMPPVFAALSARFGLPGVPDWSGAVWLLLGLPWLLFMIVAISVRAFDVGLIGVFALTGSVCGFAIANIVYCASAPTRVRKRVLDEHGDAIIAAALAGLPAQVPEGSLAASLQARLLELGLTSYVLRRTIVQTVLATPPNERQPSTIVRSCQARFERRTQMALVIVVIALFCSCVAVLALGFGAHRLWPPLR